MPRPEREAGGEVLEKPKPKTRKPRLFHVVLEAFRIMMQVHLEGKGVCGAYTYEEAETKVATVHDLARDAGFPLRATVEEA